MARQVGLRWADPAKDRFGLVRIGRFGGVISWIYARRGQPPLSPNVYKHLIYPANAVEEMAN